MQAFTGLEAQRCACVQTLNIILCAIDAGDIGVQLIFRADQKAIGHVEFHAGSEVRFHFFLVLNGNALNRTAVVGFIACRTDAPENTEAIAEWQSAYGAQSPGIGFLTGIDIIVVGFEQSSKAGVAEFGAPILIELIAEVDANTGVLVIAVREVVAVFMRLGLTRVDADQKPRFIGCRKLVGYDDTGVNQTDKCKTRYK